MSNQLTITDITTGETLYAGDAQVELHVNVAQDDVDKVKSLMNLENFVMSIGSNNSLQVDTVTLKYNEFNLQNTEPDPNYPLNGNIIIGVKI